MQGVNNLEGQESRSQQSGKWVNSLGWVNSPGTQQSQGGSTVEWYQQFLGSNVQGNQLHRRCGSTGKGGSTGHGG